MNLWHVFIMHYDNAPTHSKDTNSIIPFHREEVHSRKTLNLKKNILTSVFDSLSNIYVT